ncbi:hypothetical protein [Neolewinella persica]|uniref:hypothetical protein n=1 Tax=Neolewinella persica TaxID=70998 RepID=UPI000381C9A3|nr:hypothetical protein [Neolewinella persica]
MRYLLLLACFTLILGSACNKKVATTAANDTPATSPVKTIAFGATGMMKIGETFKLGGANMEITFVEVLSDNRCPRGVNCIQAGEAVVSIRINENTPQRITIGNDPKAIARLPIEGGALEMLDLSPYPEDGVRIDPAQRILRIRMVAGKTQR